MDADKLTAYKIIEQAVFDYKSLKIKGVEKIKTHKRESSYSIPELVSFFTGSWCKTLLRELHINLTGEEIMAKIEEAVKMQKEEEKVMA